MNAPLIPFDSIRVPLRVAEGGVIRVGMTRISLDLIVEQYKNGMTPDEFVLAYDTLDIADVYAVIAFYLLNREAVEEYVKRREEEADLLQAQIEAKHPPLSRRELLRRAATKNTNAPTSK